MAKRFRPRFRQYSRRRSHWISQHPVATHVTLGQRSQCLYQSVNTDKGRFAAKRFTDKFEQFRTPTEAPNSQHPQKVAATRKFEMDPATRTEQDLPEEEQNLLEECSRDDQSSAASSVVDLSTPAIAPPAPVKRVPVFRPPHVFIARYTPRIPDADTGGSDPNQSKPRRMHYEANAMPPATREEHSMYPMKRDPVTHLLGRDPASREAPIDPHETPGPKDFWERISFHRGVREDIENLWAEKLAKMPPPPRPNTATSEKTGRLDPDTGHQSDAEGSGGGPKPQMKTKETDYYLRPWAKWDDDVDPEDSDRDFTMFEDTPRDRSLVEETEERVFPPWDTSEPSHTPSISALSSMAVWDPEVDADFQIDAQWNLEKWNDFRFKVPEKPEDIESLQHALEITRVDFWLRNPTEQYPEDLSQYKEESYGSQHRRLQHAFCRIWQEFESEPAPELYRLPAWIFGFQYCHWKPSSWGFDERSNAYYQFLAEMAMEKNETGLWNFDYRECRAIVQDLLAASPSPTLEDWSQSE